MIFEKRFHSFFHAVRKDTCEAFLDTEEVILSGPSHDPAASAAIPPFVRAQAVEAMGWTPVIKHEEGCAKEPCTCAPLFYYLPPDDVAKAMGVAHNKRKEGTGDPTTKA